MNRKPLTLSVPHKLTQEEARRRIAAGVEEARLKHSNDFVGVKETWNGNRMDFHLGVLGQSITGRVDVGPDAVMLEVDLPWVFAALAGRAKAQIQEEARKLLERKP